MRRITPVLYVLIALGALAGLYGAWKRYEVEGLNKRVELALEYAEVKTLADMTGQPVRDVLKRLGDAGVTSVAVTEETLAGLESHGELRATADSSGTTVYASTPQVLDRVRTALISKGVRIGPEPGYTGPVTRFVVAPQSSVVSRQSSVLTQQDSGLTTHDSRLTTESPSFTAKAEYTSLRNLGVGLDQRVLDTIRSVKVTNATSGLPEPLQPVGRIGNFPGASPETMANVLRTLHDQGVWTVIFVGNDVLGFRGLEKQAAQALRESGVNYGQIEFGKQRGDEALGVALKGEYIRVHSIGEAELGTLDENEAIDRFVRGARERNIRLCYIRLLFTAGADPVGDNATFLEKIQRGIARGHEMTFGVAHVFGETSVPRWLFPIIGVGAAAGLVLLLIRLFSIPDKRAGLVLAASVLICASLAALGGEMGRKLVALLAAIVFPAIACLRRDILEDGGRRTEDGPDSVLPVPSVSGLPSSVNPTKGASAFAIKGLAVASAVTAIGILHVVGLLATRPFMLKANQFLGIKAAHAVPIIIIGLLAIFGPPRLTRPWAEEWSRLKERAARIFGEPTRVGQILLALAALAALAFIVARTGNEPGVGVSGIELKFRSLLDKLLPVRPRTKEFLIGHPAFVLALALWFRGRRKWVFPLYVVGVIGQVSILNTFCHIHTPLVLSLIRDVTGLVAGALIGLLLFWLIEKLMPEPVGAAEGGPQTTDDRSHSPTSAVVTAPGQALRTPSSVVGSQ